MVRIGFAAFAFLLAAALGAAAAAAERVDLVRVDKAERRMELVSGGRVVRSYSIALGGNPVGHKQREGDGRTPEGRYVLDWRNAGSAFHKSIHVSIPTTRTGLPPRGAASIRAA